MSNANGVRPESFMLTPGIDIDNDEDYISSLLWNNDAIPQEG
ncbi:hypothetical protein GPB2148_1201 [marine gamma proteobacterium HTCC2148]|nr:hypothetical protein GPB2148_1201 [marine gamma proteobacterium HTCC2148]